MKKIGLFAMLGILCVALSGCGEAEPAPEEQSADPYIEQLENDIQTMIEEEEAQHEAELEAQYPEGILPAGHYRAVDNTPDGFIDSFTAEYDVEHEEGIIIESYNYIGQPNWFTIPSYYVNSPENCYVYDPETGLYHFEIYYAYAGEWNLLETIEGYYKAEDDTFVMTSIYSEERGFSTEEGYECVYQRE